MEAKEKVQIRFQAKNDIKMKIGQILPQLNTYGIAITVIDPGIGLDAIIPLVGFLFPSRWLEWKASRMIRDAEKEALAASFANIAQHIQRLYYDIQQQNWSIHVLNFYMEEINKLIGSP